MVERGSSRKLILPHRFSKSLKAEVPLLDSLGKKGKQALWWSACRNAPTKPQRLQTMLPNREGNVNVSWAWADFRIIYLFQITNKVIDGSVTPNHFQREEERRACKVLGIILRNCSTSIINPCYGPTRALINQVVSYFVGESTVKLRRQVLQIII